MPSRQITDLCEELQGTCTEFLARCNGSKEFKEKDATAFITCTYRSNEEQDFEYAKGRTAKGIPCKCGGKVNFIGSCPRHPFGYMVTKAKAGDSPHNCVKDGKPNAMAFDFAIRLPDGSLDWDTNHLWIKAINVGQALGLQSGVKWKDAAHMELVGWRDKR